MLIELPSNVIASIGGIVLALLGLAIHYIGSYVPWLESFLEKYRQEWGVALSAILVAWIQNGLPGGEYLEVSTLAVQLVVAAVVLGLSKLGLARLGVRGFK